MDALSKESHLIWKIYSFQLPFVFGGFRNGLLICLKDHHGEEKWGEVAPFPGRSQETLSDALKQLLQLFNNKKVENPLFPSVQFGLESALEAPCLVSAPLYALLYGDPETVLKQAAVALKQGYKTVKLKISSFPLDVSREIIQELKKDFRIRIDCNSAFTFDQAMSLFSSFDEDIFDYIEDPTFELEHLNRFTFPFALDETVLKYQSLPLNSYSHLYGFILKPTLIGGRKGCAPLIEFAQKNQLKVVFSPTFESSLGLFQILCLAKKFNLTSDPLGLDTFRYLKNDILVHSLNFNVPYITLTKFPQIDLDSIQEIAHGTCELPPL
jgi:O-succinylbenzoate synthase